MNKDPIVIVGCARTPMGSFQGELSSLSATDLGSHAISAAINRSGLDPAATDEVFMGCVLSAGLGQAPARQAALKAGIPQEVGCTTVNKVCGSGMKAVMLGHDLIKANSGQIIVSGGMESMSNAPYLIPKARSGLRLGHGTFLDHIYKDGLEDAYPGHRLMGSYAEDCAKHYNFTREVQDTFALESLQKARKASQDGSFSCEITAIEISEKFGDRKVLRDEQPFRTRPEKIPLLDPVFHKNGSVTAANSSSISDGAAALILMRQSKAQQLALTAAAKILGHASYAGPPSGFTTAPILAIKQLLARYGLSVSDVDLFEINEAFAVVALAAMKELALPREHINIHGGACALGHPIGASGARIIITLISALQQYNLKTGIAALCIGGGEATAIAVENLNV